MKIKTTYKKTIFLAFWAAYLLIGPRAYSETTKEVWLQFKGTNECQKSFCADGIPSKLLENALLFFSEHQDIIKNKKYLTIIDYSVISTKKRMFILNLQDGSVQKYLVAHGKFSESEDEPGMAKYFSNIIESKQSSIGFFLTAKNSEFGKRHGEILRLDGLSSTNSNARVRNIVLHSGFYATQEFANRVGRLGLSHGCPVVSPEKVSEVITRIKGKSIIYIYSDLESL